MPTRIAEHTVPWPAPDAARYVAAGYWAGTPIGQLLWPVADATPEATALVDSESGLQLGYRQLLQRADACGIRLRELGLAPGDRVVVQLPNGWEFVVLTLACLRAGIVPVMALPAHRRSELRYLATHAEAAAIAVPDVMREFDHQGMAHDLADDVRAATGGRWQVLVAGEHIA